MPRRPWTSEDSSSERGEGDHDAFAELARGAVTRLDAAARLILRDPELARDAVQEALIRAWRDLPGLRDPDRFDAWLHRLTVNACLDIARRRRRRRPSRSSSTPIDCPVASDMAGALADRELVDAAMRRLDDARPGDRRPALLPRDAADRRRGDPRHPDRHGQVAAPSRPGRDAGRGRDAEPAAPVAGHGRAGRMTTPTRLERTLPVDPRRPGGGTHPRLPRRRPRADRPDAAAARLDVPRKVAPHG